MVSSELEKALRLIDEGLINSLLILYESNSSSISEANALRHAVKELGYHNTLCLVINEASVNSIRKLLGRKHFYADYKVISERFMNRFLEIINNNGYVNLFTDLSVDELSKASDPYIKFFAEAWSPQPVNYLNRTKLLFERKELLVNDSWLRLFDPVFFKQLESFNYKRY